MKRTNTLVVRPRSQKDERLLREVLDASASLWNELTFARRQNFFDDESVWDADDCYSRYNNVLGAATTRTVIRKNDAAWRSFFKKDDGRTNLPGYRGNEEDGRMLMTHIRNDSYTLEFGDRSRLEIPVGKDLKEKYDLGYYERLRLEVAGEPRWDGKQGQLEIKYDEHSNQFRAFQPIEVADSHPRLGTPLADETAALDIGANNLVACSTTTGTQLLYHGRNQFERFRKTTHEIARLQSKLPENRYSSKRIRSLYRGRTNRRDHMQNTLVRDLVERLHDEGVSTIWVGELKGVLLRHWSVRANAKTHNFWAFRAFINRLECTAEEFGIAVEEALEAWTSQKCPECGSTDRTIRERDSLTCPCGFEGHADLTASETFLRQQDGEYEPRPTARPVRFEWDDHGWSETPYSHERPKEVRTHQSTLSV
ncbi:RNA-guided endonuclease InsQ/TnpB family protein [Halocatena marina]|uniref:RNA-guided endonuclease InsQ/TnpB family protein n=1 Tax=Halocatena marina TaxID=2934937 RepID=A0ABD5YTR9_9EURY|nr:transposase [Halocatena marina]